MLDLSFPPNENQRIAALQSLQILDTPPEERFDRITRIASRLFNVPIALISLVDSDRLWFKSRRGLSIRESSRSGSFCSQAILSKEIFIVPDAKRDPRFSAHPWVVAPPPFDSMPDARSPTRTVGLSEHSQFSTAARAA